MIVSEAPGAVRDGRLHQMCLARLCPVPTAVYAALHATEARLQSVVRPVEQPVDYNRQT